MPNKAKLVLREITTTTVTEDELKSSPLTFQQIDSNFINLRDQTIGIAGDDSTTINLSAGNTIKIAGAGTVTTAVSGDTLTITGTGGGTAQGITVVGDDSTGTLIADGETIKIAGTQNITTAVSGDTLTITGPNLSSYITASSTDALTNKTFDANGTGNSITNIEVADLAAGVLDTDLTSVSASDDTLPSAKAVKTYIDAQNTAQAITFVGDDSTGTAVNSGETFKIAGTQNITTAVSGDTLTITGPDLSSYLTNSTITVVGDDSTGTILNSGETVKIAGTQNITTAVSGDTVTITGPDLSSYATTSYVDSQISATNTLTIADDTSTTGSIDLDNTLQVLGGNNITTSISGGTLTISGDKSIDVNEINSGDSSAIQINDAVNVSGTLNAKTIVTNDLISEDSSAINVLDGLNVSGTLSADVLDVNEISSGDSSAIQINDDVNISGATTINSTLSVAGDITSADSLQFDTTSTETVATGKLYYSGDYGTLAHGLGDGTEIIDGVDLVAYVTNAEANTLTKGEVVYIFGASGDRPSVKRADNSGDPTSSKTLGIVKNDITAGGAGYVKTQGIVTGLNTATYTAGDVLWLGTGGAFTATKPAHPAHLVFVGVVLRANAGNGLVYVKPQNGYELDELHDVDVSTAVANDILKYDGSAWFNVPGGELIYNGNSITAASNADIDITAGGTGNINLNADTIRLGDSGANATLTTNGAGDIIINTNSGTNSGTITIEDGANGNIKIVPNGTGNVELGSEVETTTNFPSAMTSGSYDPTNSRVRGAMRAYSNLSVAPYTSQDDSIIASVDYSAIKTNGGTFSSTNTRTVGSDHTINFDLNGSDASALNTNGATATRASRQQVFVKNTAGGTKTSFIAAGSSSFLQVEAGHGGALTVPQIHGHNASAIISANTGETSTVTQYRGFTDLGVTTSGTGTAGTAQILTDYYGFHTGNNPSSFGSGTVITNRPFAFFTNNSTWRSRIGYLDQHRILGRAETHSSGGNFTIDLSASGTGLYIITLTSNITGFTFTNAPAVTNGYIQLRLLFLQDGTGGRTISFTPAGGETFLFKNGVNTLADSTAAPEGLVAEVFTSRHDGSNTRYYWNIDNQEYVRV